jgi:ribosomal protein L29
MTESSQLEELAAQANHARERYSLYRAKTLSSRPTSPGRLRELKRASLVATARAERAKTNA